MGVPWKTNRAALVAYCQCYARWVEAEAHLKTTPILIRTKTGYLPERRSHFKGLQAVHKIGVVIRFREYGAGENNFGCLAPVQVLGPTRTTLENN